MSERPLRRIAINGASLSQRVTGVQRYARELTRHLLGDPDVRLLLPSPVPDFEPPAGSRIRVVPPSRLLSRAGAHGWVHSALPSALEPDELLWSPTVRAPVELARHVMTLHDLSVLDHPEWFTRATVLQWRMLMPIVRRRARHIVTISEFSRDRLLQRLQLDADRVSVVPCGVDESFFEVGPEDVRRVREELQLPERFALSVGSVDPRKNLRLLLEAWPRVWRETGLSLVVVGGGARTFAAQRLDLLDQPGVVRLGYVDQADLPALYAAAEVAPFPSLYEGFGLPPLEAMAAGTPVVALASTPAVAEVVGEAGVLVEEPGPDAYARALVELVDDEAARTELVRRGRDRAAEYTWSRAGERLRGVLDEQLVR